MVRVADVGDGARLEGGGEEGRLEGSPLTEEDVALADATRVAGGSGHVRVCLLGNAAYENIVGVEQVTELEQGGGAGHETSPNVRPGCTGAYSTFQVYAARDGGTVVGAVEGWRVRL